jgi:thiamine-phosphate pyrophosphorylase
VLGSPRLIVLSDTTRAAAALLLQRYDALAQSATAGSVLFLVRDYELSVRARLELAEGIRALARRSAQRFGVADRADLALALGADAVHLPESGLTIADARRYLGPTAFISRACHDPECAAELGADGLLLSPIFAARKGRPPLGIAALARACALSVEARGPALYALGAVDADNAGACLAAGAQGIAVIGAALSPQPEPLLKALKISRH